MAHRLDLVQEAEGARRAEIAAEIVPLPA